MKDIVSIGEILIDLTQSGVNSNNIPRYDANPGGAPMNLAVAASRFGAKTAFIGKVGNDSFGVFLKDALRKSNVDISGVTTDESRTTLAVVSVDEHGERSFSFYRNPSADVNLRIRDIPLDMIANTRFLHFGSVSLTNEPSRSATLYAVSYAKEHGAFISYDPNYREALWENKEAAIEQMRGAARLADVIKVSDEELPLLTGTDEMLAGARELSDGGAKLIFVTLGADGAFYYYKGAGNIVHGVKCDVVSTNGAGDTFFGAALSRLARYDDLSSLTVPELEEIVAFANKAASISVGGFAAGWAQPADVLA